MSSANWATLAKIACVLLMSSMPAERGCSLQNRIKMALQSRLEEERIVGIPTFNANFDHLNRKSWVETLKICIKS